MVSAFHPNQTLAPASASDPLRTLAEFVKLAFVNKMLAVAGVTTVILMAGVMLADADFNLWKYPDWAMDLILVAALGLLANALARPRLALASPAIGISILIGLALAWPVIVGGTG